MQEAPCTRETPLGLTPSSPNSYRAQVATVVGQSTLTGTAIGVILLAQRKGVESKRNRLSNPRRVQPCKNVCGQIKVPARNTFPLWRGLEAMRVGRSEMVAKGCVHLIAWLRDGRPKRRGDPGSARTQRLHCGQSVLQHPAIGTAPSGMGCAHNTRLAVCEKDRTTIGGHDGEHNILARSDKRISHGSAGRLIRPNLPRNTYNIRRMDLMRRNQRSARKSSICRSVTQRPDGRFIAGTAKSELMRPARRSEKAMRHAFERLRPNHLKRGAFQISHQGCERLARTYRATSPLPQRSVPAPPSSAPRALARSGASARAATQSALPSAHWSDRARG